MIEGRWSSLRWSGGDRVVGGSFFVWKAPRIFLSEISRVWTNSKYTKTNYQQTKTNRSSLEMNGGRFQGISAEPRRK